MTAHLVKRFTANTAGRDLIVGDIHGYFSKLVRELEEIGFDPSRDRLFSVGDLVDRGPESDQALEWLALPWFHAVAGNHEDYAIRFPLGHMDPINYAMNGGAWNICNPFAAQVETSEAFKALPVAIELETALGLVGIVHAECPCSSWSDFVSGLVDPDASNNERKHLISMAQWSRRRAELLFDDTVSGVRAVVVGHHPMDNWTSLGNTIYIDTKGWKGGRFTILDAATLSPASMPNRTGRLPVLSES